MINMKNLDPNIIKIDENSNNKIFIITLVTRWSKTLAMQKVILQINYTLLSIKQIDTLKKGIEVDI